MALKYCSLFSGSSGNSAVISTPSSSVLIDAGLNGKTITCALERVNVDPASLQGILITHEHSDHIRGAGVLSRRFDLPIFANAATWEAMDKTLGCITTKNVRVIDTGRNFYIGDLDVLPYAIEHDAAEPVGYCFYGKGRKFAQMTDLGHAPQSVLSIVSGADLVLLEANHDIDMLRRGPYPQYLKKRILSNHGHLSNDASAEACLALLRMGVKNFILGHLSQENNTEKLAYDTVCTKLQSVGALLDEDFVVSMAHRDRASGYFELD